ncbi:hypothetical protein ACROYT_G040398 [Oculina patagonica]
MASHDSELINAEDLEEVKEYIKQNGVSKIKELFKKKLEKWQDVEVNIGITGDTGAGKSSFINAIRGLNDDDHMAAPVGVTEMTVQPTWYDHPTNPKIKFCDLPGIGSPKYPDIETYCKEVKLEELHAFLIFTSTRFTDNDSQLAKKIEMMDKKFFFIRAKIDQDVQAEKRKWLFNEDATLKRIQTNCSTNLAELLRNEEDIFLISNHDPAKWDFDRLSQAILDALPIYQRESLTLSLSILTSSSSIILQRKVEILRRRMWIIASISASVAVFPIPGLSIAMDLLLIMEEISFYRSQLGIPQEGSDRFAMLSGTTQKEVKAIWATMASVTQVGGLVAKYASEQAAEEVTRMIPFVGFLAAGAMSCGSTYYFLKHCLENMEKTALLVLKEASDNFPID